jgi:hypothetical protein
VADSYRTDTCSCINTKEQDKDPLKPLDTTLDIGELNKCNQDMKNVLMPGKTMSVLEPTPIIRTDVCWNPNQLHTKFDSNSPDVYDDKLGCGSMNLQIERDRALITLGLKNPEIGFGRPLAPSIIIERTDKVSVNATTDTILEPHELNSSHDMVHVLIREEELVGKGCGSSVRAILKLLLKRAKCWVIMK